MDVRLALDGRERSSRIGWWDVAKLLAGRVDAAGFRARGEPMIQFPCSVCGWAVVAQDSLAGQKTTCPGCHEAVAVPALPPSFPTLPPLEPPRESKWVNLAG